MGKKYTRLCLEERKAIEDCLGRGDSVNEIGRILGRSPSTVLREIVANRSPERTRGTRPPCFMRRECERKGVCGEGCESPGLLCSACRSADCRRVCAEYLEHGRCAILSRAPYVCNRCKRRRYACGRPERYVYDAKVAQAMAETRRSEARRGIDMEEDRAEAALSRIKEALSRGLSPYEISVLYADEVGVHRSTIYRWVEAGYGGMTNLELERKVGFRPRRKDPARRATSHSPRRAYSRFEALPERRRAAAMEMDTLVGRSCDTQAVLTLYHRPSDLQLALLLRERACEEVKGALAALKGACRRSLFAKLFGCVLTDNGSEMEDEEGIADILGEGRSRGAMTRLYYCDVRQSQQKGACEKNHSELRQILRKGMFVFDELDERDLAVAMCHANSNPREGLCGMSPIRMFLAAYGDAGEELLDALGVRQMERSEIVLAPEILDIERGKRGKEPLTRLI